MMEFSLALLQSEIPGVARFFVALGLVFLVAGGAVVFTYWLSKGE